VTVTEKQAKRLRRGDVEERPKDFWTLLWVGVLLAAGFWVLEAAIHAFFFYEGTFLQELVPRDTHELYMRLLVCALLAAFGMYAQSAVNRIRKTDRERLALQKKLERKLTHVLSDYVHICPNCKNIRGEGGHWDPIETYIHEEPNIDLSHSLCPECMARLYPRE
jgi:hypothetical protein